MTRRFQFLLGVMLTLALLLGTTATSSAAGSRAQPRLSAPNLPAAGPQSVSPPNRSVNRAQLRADLRADLAALGRQTAGSPYRLGLPKGKLPAAVRAAVAVRESLSPAQQKQLQAAFAKFSSRLEQIAGPANASGATRGKAPQNVRRQAARLAKLNGSLDRAVSKILTRQQLANNRAALRPALAKLGSSSSQAAATGQRASAAVQPTTLGSYCYYAAYYELLANWWKYWGYYYAYYNYVTYGDTYAYYGYYYGYYAYLYGIYAAELIPQTYFEYLASGYDWKGIGDDGVNYAYLDYYYAYYSRLYDYYSYYYYGHSYAYYAYYYEYYGQSYAYYAYYYAYYYCQ